MLAVSPHLATLSAKAVVAIFHGRMQIGQSFRDLKNVRCGLRLSASQTHQSSRLAILLLIGALVYYALWLIAFVLQSID